MTRLHGQTFLQTYGTPNVDEVGSAIAVAPNGNVVVSGGHGIDAAVTMFSPNGQPLWSRSFPAPSSVKQLIQHIVITPDGYIVGVGNSATSPGQTFRHDGFVFKMDLNGNLIWHKAESHPNAIYYDKVVVIDPSNYLVVCGFVDVSSYWSDPVLARIDAQTGDVLAMSPRMDLNPSGYLDDPAGLAIGANGDYYISGRLYMNGSSPASMRPFIIRLHPNFNVVWVKYYLTDVSNAARLYGQAMVPDGNDLVINTFGDRFGASSNFTVGLLKIDLDGNLLWAKDYDIPNSSQEVTWGVVTNPQGYCMVGKTNTSKLFALQTDLNGSLLWTKEITLPGTGATIDFFSPPAADANGRIWFTGYQPDTDSKLILGSMDYLGNIQCAPTNAVTPLLYTYPSFVATISADTDNDNLPVVNGPLSQPFSLPDPCLGLAVDLGPDTSLCAGAIVLDATTTGATAYLWSDGSTNSTLTVSSSGTYWVQVVAGCCTRSDTVTVSLGGLLVDIGSDTALCPLETQVLDAGNAGGTYSWSNGATTQTIIANGPGQYTVTVTSATGCIGIDTLNIGLGTLAVDLGNDYPLCNGDSALLDAGFAGGTYAWNTGSNQQSIWASVAGPYSVTVTNATGCMGADTLVILANVFGLDLGNDTTACRGISHVLDAGNPGATYLWSNGATTQAIAVTGTGSYAVTVTFGPTCLAVDTVQVVFGGPVVDLGRDTVLCASDTLVLMAGLGGTEYLWNTGDTTVSIVIDGPGLYAVTVTDTLGCTAGDTLIVSQSSLPTISLGPDQERCGEEGITLKSPILGLAYLWNTGATDDTIFADTTATYTLQVTTQCGVVQTSVHIELIKESRLFVPNVFSPNGDGINDGYEIGGPVYEGFELQIYDRWGRRLYRSLDIHDHWDGKWAGSDCPDGIYYYALRVLNCDRKLVNITGPITLIR